MNRAARNSLSTLFRVALSLDMVTLLSVPFCFFGFVWFKADVRPCVASSPNFGPVTQEIDKNVTTVVCGGLLEKRASALSTMLIRSGKTETLYKLCAGHVSIGCRLVCYQHNHVDLWALMRLFRTFCVGSEFGSHAKCGSGRPNLVVAASAAIIKTYEITATRHSPSSSCFPKP